MNPFIKRQVSIPFPTRIVIATAILAEYSQHEPNLAASANSALTLNITKYQFANNDTPGPEFDYDEDGYATDVDVFPIDAEEWADTDGDGTVTTAMLSPTIRWNGQTLMRTE